MKELADTDGMQAGQVYAVIPVFNRVKQTLGCIDCLKRQSHSNVRIIVVDGGSTDGTPQIIRQQHPDIIVLTSKETLWWGGATRLGIDWALSDGADEKDFILMVNNDTRFGPRILEYLIETSRKYKAAVGGVVVSADDPNTVIDGGITLDWQEYQFSTVKEIPSDIVVKLDCDVLPGRCSLVPVWSINQAGNIDDKLFPHYIADYEFTHRLKRECGLNLAVDYRARVETRVNPILKEVERKKLRDVLWESINRRSKSNFIDHLRFIRKHAPTAYRMRLILRLLRARVSFSWSPARKTSQLLFVLKALAHKILIILRRITRLFFGTYLVSEANCCRFGLCSRDLRAEGILTQSGYPGYFLFIVGLRQLQRQAPKVLPLYWWVWRPDIKLRDYFAVRSKHYRNCRTRQPGQKS